MIGSGQWRAAAEAAPVTFARDPAVARLAVVDEHDRPVGLVDRRGGVHPPLRVLPAVRLAEPSDGA